MNLTEEQGRIKRSLSRLRTNVLEERKKVHARSTQNFPFIFSLISFCPRSFSLPKCRPFFSLFFFKRKIFVCPKEREKFQRLERKFINREFIFLAEVRRDLVDVIAFAVFVVVIVVVVFVITRYLDVYFAVIIVVNVSAGLCHRFGMSRSMTLNWFLKFFNFRLKRKRKKFFHNSIQKLGFR